MRGLVLIVIALFMVSCGSQGNYVTFKAPTFRQLANCEPWQQKMFTDFCEWKYYDSDVKQNWCSIKRAGRTCTNNIL